MALNLRRLRPVLHARKRPDRRIVLYSFAPIAIRDYMQEPPLRDETNDGRSTTSDENAGIKTADCAAPDVHPTLRTLLQHSFFSGSGRMPWKIWSVPVTDTWIMTFRFYFRCTVMIGLETRHHKTPFFGAALTLNDHRAYVLVPQRKSSTAGTWCEKKLAWCICFDLDRSLRRLP